MMMSMVDTEAIALRERWRRILTAIPAAKHAGFFAERLIDQRGPSVLLSISLGFALMVAVRIAAESCSAS